MIIKEESLSHTSCDALNVTSVSHAMRMTSCHISRLQAELNKVKIPHFAWIHLKLKNNFR